MKHKIFLTALQRKIVSVLEVDQPITVMEVAKKVYQDVPNDMRPKSINNSITSAIIQINKKVPNLIRGENLGCQGKVLFMTENDRSKVTLGSTRV